MSDIKIRIGVDKQVIDTDIVNKISVKKSLNSNGKRKADYTRSIRILNTNQTAKIFKNLFDINSTNGFPTTTPVVADIMMNGIVVIDGYITIENITNKYYDVIIYTKEVELVKSFGEDDFYTSNIWAEEDSEPFTYTTDFVRNSYSAYTEGQSYVFPLINYSRTADNSAETKEYDLTNVAFSSAYPVYPAINVLKLFDGVMKTKNFTYSLSPMMEMYMKRMYIPYNRDKYSIGFNNDSDLIQATFPSSSNLKVAVVGNTTYKTLQAFNVTKNIYPISDYFLETLDVFYPQHEGDLTITFSLGSGSRNNSGDITAIPSSVGIVVRDYDGNITESTVNVPFAE